MKLITTKHLWATLLVAFAFTACQKTDIPAPEENTGIQSARRQTNTQATTYGGQATGLNATIFNRDNYVVTSYQTILAQTNPLSSTGGTEQASQSEANISGAFSADQLTASTTGESGRTVSESTVSNFTITVGGNVITGTSLTARAVASCGSFSGTTTVTGLVVNGVPVNVTGAANQSVHLPNGGLLLINQQNTKKGKNTANAVTGLHLMLSDGTTISLATVRAEVKC